MRGIQEFLDEVIRVVQENPYCQYPEMGKVSCPILEVMIRTAIVADRKWMPAVTESPIKAGMCSTERAESKGISCFLRGFRDDFGVRD